MNKYTVVYTASSRYDQPLWDAESRVDYIQGKTLEEAIDGHIEYMKSSAIEDIVGEVIIFEGHVKQVDMEKHNV
jgi:predicted RNA-binding protein|tara:strand:- start:463 stop:684 length:222 start_codon:yes stop_codon:yes gene_type:complete